MAEDRVLRLPVARVPGLGTQHWADTAWHGRDERSALDGLDERDVADIALVVAGVDFDGAGVDPVASHKVGASDGSHEKVTGATRSTTLLVREWRYVTVASRSRSSMPTGLPTIGLRPITTACRPSSATLWASRRRTMLPGVQEAKRGKPKAIAATECKCDAVNVLGRCDRLENSSLVHVSGNGMLDEDAIDARINKEPPKAPAHWTLTSPPPG